MTLADDQAVVIDLHDGKGLQLVREDAAPRRVAEAFGHGDQVTVPPDREVIDVFDCRIRATPAGCRKAQIYRYDVAGTLLASLPVPLPEAYSDCQLTGIKGYDKERIPYVFAQCGSGSLQAKCVVVAPRKDVTLRIRRWHGPALDRVLRVFARRRFAHRAGGLRGTEVTVRASQTLVTEGNGSTRRHRSSQGVP